MDVTAEGLNITVYHGEVYHENVPVIMNGIKCEGLYHPEKSYEKNINVARP